MQQEQTTGLDGLLQARELDFPLVWPDELDEDADHTVVDCGRPWHGQDVRLDELDLDVATARQPTRLFQRHRRYLQRRYGQPLLGQPDGCNTRGNCFPNPTFSCKK